MTKNVKNFALAHVALTKLAAQVASEAKADPRLARTKKRCARMVAALDMALKKYEQVHGRKVPMKIAERKAGVVKKVAKKVAKKRVAKAKVSNVVELKPATAAAARKRALVKRSK